MNESAPFGASATASTRSAARKRRWLPRIKRVGFWRAFVEYSLVLGAITVLMYLIIWNISFGWGVVVGTLSSIVYAVYAWRLDTGSGSAWRRIGRVMAWIGGASLLQSALQIVLWNFTPDTVTFLGQQINNQAVSPTQTLGLTVAFAILLFLPLRTFVALTIASRHQLRWRLTLSYILVGLLISVLIPVGFIVVGAIFAAFSLPSFSFALTTPQHAAAALTPLVQQQTPAIDLATTMQGIIDGSVRLPPADIPNDATSDPDLSMQLINVQRLTVLRSDNTVVASVGVDTLSAGTTVPAEELIQIEALRAQTPVGGCREGIPAGGLTPDHAVCALADKQGQILGLLVAETITEPVTPGGLEGTQLFLLVGAGIIIILALTPFTMLVILPVAGGGVGYVLAGRLTKRIERLTTAAGDIAAGNLDRRVEIDSEDEVGRLANDFNTMAAKLAEREHALAAAAQRAEALLRANKRLVADVSHELRTPLTTVRGYLEALTHEHSDTLPHRDLRVIDGEMQRLTHLIEDLFTLARTEAQQLPLQIAPTDACALAMRLVDALAPLARRERQIEVIAALPNELPPVCADQTRLEQVLQNLIQNALRYTPAGGIVALEAAATDHYVTLSVADTGMGIDRDELPRVWERFYRSDRSRARETGGAGLGLALVKELVTAMGGTVSAESTLGRGSKFSITLRRADGATVTRSTNQ